MIRGESPSEGPRGRQALDEPSRNLVSISPFFIVEDLSASIAYYVDRLGFRLDFQGPESDPYYGRVSRDGIGIMLKAILPDVPSLPNRRRHEWARWDAYIYTADPDSLFDELRERGASFVSELSFIDEGLWGFEVSDADGYVLAFFQLRDDPATPQPPSAGEGGGAVSETGAGPESLAPVGRERAVAILPGDDLAVAKAFYVDRLGFRVEWEDTSDGKSGIMGIVRGGLELTIDCPMSGHGRNVCVSLRVSDADAYYELWREAVEIPRPPQDEVWGGRTFGFQDPSGNDLFVIGPVRGHEGGTSWEA